MSEFVHISLENFTFLILAFREANAIATILGKYLFISKSEKTNKSLCLK